VRAVTASEAVACVACRSCLPASCQGARMCMCKRSKFVLLLFIVCMHDALWDRSWDCPQHESLPFANQFWSWISAQALFQLEAFAPMVLDIMGAPPRIALWCVRLLGLATAIAGLALHFVQMVPVQPE